MILPIEEHPELVVANPKTARIAMVFIFFVFIPFFPSGYSF
jgi:hypothetical protein